MLKVKKKNIRSKNHITKTIMHHLNTDKCISKYIFKVFLNLYILFK